MPRKCIEDGCNKCALFNLLTLKSPIYCSTHKKDNMINVHNKRCEHNRRKTRCIECDGGSICEHNRQKSGCIVCGGRSICAHNKRKSDCKECRGSAICEHNKFRSGCRQCSGSQICEHAKFRSRCKECKGGSICEHNRVKSLCKECKGGSICEHNRRKSECKECKGGTICEHNKRRDYCKLCGGSRLCKSSWCEIVKSPKYEGYCFSCFVHLFPDRPNAKNYKTKEKATSDYILKRFHDFTWVTDKMIQDGCSRKRPDLLLDLGYQVIIIEIDENQHELYDCSCENKRLMLLSQDVSHRPIIFIRFNPDDYVSGTKKVTSCWSLNRLGVCSVKNTKVKEWNKRLEVLNAQIAYWTHSDNKTEKIIEIVQLFYDCD